MHLNASGWGLRRWVGLWVGLAGMAGGVMGQPVLEIRQATGGRVDLLWATNPPGFRVESSDVLSLSGAWQPSLGQPVVEGTRWVLGVTASDATRYFRLRQAGPLLPTVVETSPSSGERGVAVTRETVVRLSAPLSADSVVDGDKFFAGFGGRRLLSRVEVAADRRSVTLFHLENLPASARVNVVLDTAGLRDASGLEFDGDGDGKGGGLRVLEYVTAGTEGVPGTAVEGRVYASEKAPGGTNRPLAGVTVTVDGAEETLRAVTDAAGYFRLEPSPAGRFFVHVDGRTAEGSSWPGGAYYPFVGKAWEAVAGKTNNLAGGTGEIFLPLVPADALRVVSADLETRVGFPSSVVATNPAMAGVEVRVPANSLFSEDGRRGGRVGIAAVPPDRLPEPLPPGLNLPLVITIQTDGPQNFDRPVPVRFPNLPDPVTGRVTPPGAKTILWSFNHDTGRWEPQGTATVTGDGKYAETDAGVGVRQPGWHGVAEGTPAEGPKPEQPEPLPEPQEPEQPEEEDPCEGQNGRFDCDGDGCPESDEECEDECEKHRKEAERLNPDCPIGSAIKNVVSQFACRLPVISWLTECPDDAWVSKFLDCREALADAKADYRICVDGQVSAGGGGARRGVAMPADAVTAMAEQRALSAAGARPYELLLGSPAWTGVEPEDFPRLAGLFGALVEAMAEASPGGRLVSAGERTALLALPRPGALDATQVGVALDRINAWVGGTLPLAERQAIEAAVKAREDLWRAYQARGWRTPFDGLLEFERLTSSSEAPGARTTFFPRRQLAYAMTLPATGQVFRGRLDAAGRFAQVILPADTYLQVTYVDPVTLAVGEAVFRSGAAGEVTGVPSATMFDSSAYPDADADGLADVVEGVLGTRADRADTDGDGVTDRQEVLAGLNPLDGQVAAQGVVAVVRTQGTPRDMAVAGDLAVVADGAAGVLLVQVADPLQPVVLGRVGLVSPALAVAAEGSRVAVAMGTGGAAVMDVSDPVRPRVLWELRHGGVGGGVNVQYTAVALRGELLLVGTSAAEVLVVDARTGLLRQRLPMSFGSTHPRVGQIRIDGGVAYVVNDHASDLLNASQLVTLSIDGQVVLPLGAAPVSRGAPATGIGRRFWVGGGYAYLGYFGGYYVYDVRDPAAPRLVGAPASAGQGVLAPLLAGNGRLVALTAFGSGQTAELSLYDVTNPTNTSGFVRSMPIGRLAWAARLHRGFALVADNSGRLLTVNLLEPDLGSTPPVLDPVVTRLPDAPGGGRRYLVDARPVDDVMVRDVEVLVGGRRVALVGAYPFQAVFTVPALPAAPEVLVRATDRAGNVATRRLDPGDPTPPALTQVSPAPGALASGAIPVGLEVSFDEPLKPETAGAGSLRLFHSGSDNQFGTADDVEIGLTAPVLTAGGRTLAATTVSNVPMREHRVVLSSGLADVSGNARTRQVSWNFLVGVGVPRPDLDLPVSPWVELDGDFPVLRLTFDSVLPAEELAKLTVQLFRAGADGVLGTGDDQPVTPLATQYDALTRGFTVTPPTGLGGGRYRLVIASPMYGMNPYRRDIEFATVANEWVAPQGGLWDTAANWSRGPVWNNDALRIPAGLSATTNAVAVNIASLRTASPWVSAANLGLSGTALATAPVRWTGGSWSGGGALDLAAGLDIESTQFANTSVGFGPVTVINRGVARFRSGLVRVTSTTARWENPAGSVLEIGSGALRFSADAGTGARGRLFNLGTIRRGVGAGAFGFDGMAVLNDGVVEAGAGELGFPAYDGAGAVRVEAGAKVVFNQVVRLRNGSRLTGGGDVDFGAQTSTTLFRVDAEVDGEFAPTGLTRLVGGRLVFLRALDLPDGQMETRADAQGGLEFLAPATLGRLTVRGAGGVRFALAGTVSNLVLTSGPLLGGGVVRAGDVTWDSAQIEDGTVLEVSRTLALGTSSGARLSRGMLRIQPGALATVAGASGFGNTAGNGVIDVRGTLLLRTNESLVFPGRLDNRGRVELAGGTLDLNPGNANVPVGQYRSLAGGVLRLQGGTLRAGTNATFVAGGEIAGAGRILRAGRGLGIADVTGVVRLDDPTAALAWTDFTVRLGATAETVVRLGASGAGRMTLSGSGAQLVVGGRLRIELEDGFVPAVGAVFTLLTAPTVTGDFSELQGAILPGVGRIEVRRITGQVQLEVVP